MLMYKFTCLVIYKWDSGNSLSCIMEGNEEVISTRYLLLGVYDTSLLLERLPITTGSQQSAVAVVLSATYFQLSQHIFLSLSYMYILKENEDEMKKKSNDDDDDDKKDNCVATMVM